LKSCCQLILDVRTSAHRPVVQTGQFLSVVLLVFIRKLETLQTVKLTLNHRPKPMSAIYRRLIHRMNQTAHISLQILSISNNVETKLTGCALTSWRAPPVIPLIFTYPPRLRSNRSQPSPPVWRPNSASLRRR